MFKNSSTMTTILCILATTIVCILLANFFHYAISICFLLVLVICCVINTNIVSFLFRKQFSKESAEREDDLRKQIEDSSKFLDLIMKNLPLATYIIDKNLNVITWNQEASNFYRPKNTPENETEKIPAYEIFSSDTVELMKTDFEYISKNKQHFLTERAVNFLSGKQCWFRLKKFPIFDKNNEVSGLAVFARNLDAEKQAQKQRETYISTLSHDLKIPTLAQIRALELLLNEGLGPINNDQKEIINLTLDSCKCMHDMLSTILSTYKYENNEITLKHEKLNILEIIDECFAKSIKILSNKNIKVSLNAKNREIYLHADKIQITKALENLIGQCIASAYENTNLVCDVKEEGQNICISLAFESPYISAEKLNNMFKMYTTSAEKLDKVGSSLNLYLSKQIIQAHNGTIVAESKETNFSTCCVVLPCINEFKIKSVLK